MTLHEFAHAWAAYKFGDQTARLSGRLTLNPLAHIDPVGTVIIPLLFFFSTGGRFVFGAAKPVPINYGMLKNPARDVVFIGASAAGQHSGCLRQRGRYQARSAGNAS